MSHPSATAPTHSRRTLVLSMPPFAHATRTRKAAIAYLAGGPVAFLAPQAVGRTGKRDVAGDDVRQGVRVWHVPVREIASSPTLAAQAANLTRTYLPVLLRMALRTLRTPADVVHVTGVPLLPLGLLHQLRHHSRLVLDVNERPASVSAKGSLYGVVARVEPWLLALGRRRADLVTVVSPGHADILEAEHGFTDVLVVRNAPPAAWRAPWKPAPARRSGIDLKVVTVGTIFEGRGFEVLIDAVALAAKSGTTIDVDIYGGGRETYLTALRQRIIDRGLQDWVSLKGPITGEQVSAAYLTGDVGLALYEAGDAGNDSLSNKIVEVVASGRPVIAGNLPENTRFVESLSVGWLTAVDTPSLAGTMVRCAQSGEVCRLAEHCRDLSLTSLTWEAEFAPVLARLEGASRS
jgi:glycosyltransferase involved in cell wall biosynthesis